MALVEKPCQFHSGSAEKVTKARIGIHRKANDEQTRSTPMKQKKTCGAYARSTGSPCNAKALANGRCKNHGGLSSGPKTVEGRQAIAEATRQRMASGGRIRALEGFYRWLEGNGGREMLSRLAKNRETRKRWQRRESTWVL